MKTKLLKKVRKTYKIYKIEGARHFRKKTQSEYLVIKKGFWEGFEEYATDLDHARRIILNDVKFYYLVDKQSLPPKKLTRVYF